MLAVDESGFYFYLSCKLALIKWLLLMPLNYCIPFGVKVSCSKKKKKKVPIPVLNFSSAPKQIDFVWI